ncbi:uncharacterized protein [Apostichopus japonicus]|uniref:uncharacterized protein n=1 Tax=Stichopus japonicus TaxID=307972 RepID=UPI003AB6964D
MTSFVMRRCQYLGCTKWLLTVRVPPALWMFICHILPPVMINDLQDHEINEDENAGDIIPNQFEPLADENEAENEVENQDERNERLQGLQWCTCNGCEIMPTAVGCDCCKEMDEVMQRVDELPQPVGCITDHPRIEPVCLNVHVRVATFQYQQQHGAGANNDIHERYRYAAYRQFVKWCLGVLGRHVRVALPACAVKKIRVAFPAAQYVRFQYPNLDD